jgi:hypothetical protein
MTIHHLVTDLLPGRGGTGVPPVTIIQRRRCACPNLVLVGGCAASQETPWITGTTKQFLLMCAIGV